MARRRSADPRPERVGNQVHATLARVLREDVKDPRVATVSITAVRMSKDLRLAHVNLVPLGGQGDPEELIEGLEAATGYLRRKLGQELRLRNTPELHWHIDEGLDDSLRMTSMLMEMEESRDEDAPDAPEDAPGVPDGDESS